MFLSLRRSQNPVLMQPKTKSAWKRYDYSLTKDRQDSDQDSRVSTKKKSRDVTPFVTGLQQNIPMIFCASAFFVLYVEFCTI